MYLSKITIENFRCFGKAPGHLELSLQPGLTALVGENDSGKTAVIEALRFALGTRDQEWYRLEDTDFYEGDTSSEIKIVCEFKSLHARDKRAFVEYLTYGTNEGDEPTLYVNWTAKDTGVMGGGRSYRRVDVCSGKDGNGPAIAPRVRELLHATYLRPLRDVEEALSAGRGSRLSQVLRRSDLIKKGTNDYSLNAPLEEQELSVLGIGNLINALLEEQQGVVGARDAIDKNLEGLTLSGEQLKSDIKVSGATASGDVRLRELLEKLDLRLDGKGKLGLGSDNLLFMACELLLLAQEDDGSRLLLIEEPEAHLHAQRQLKVMKFMQDQAAKEGIQVIVTTHSPNLASAIELDNMVMIRKKRAFSLANGETQLEGSDYRFLKRFLDVTKANLFFARGVMIVEGDAENILLPTLARLLGCDFTKQGVSIVNVGGVGLRRYARIFQRKNVRKDGELDIPVACVTDMDVMPDCAPDILGKLDNGVWPALNTRRWRAKRDIGDKDALAKHRNERKDKASGQWVASFVSDEWTLEYDLALGSKDTKGQFSGGLAEDVFVAACLAENDDAINTNKTKHADIIAAAVQQFIGIKQAAEVKDGCAVEEVIATNVYLKFTNGGVSKAIAAQYLAERLQDKYKENQVTSDELHGRLPSYLTAAIYYVAGGQKVESNEKKLAND